MNTRPLKSTLIIKNSTSDKRYQLVAMSESENSGYQLFIVVLTINRCMYMDYVISICTYMHTYNGAPIQSHAAAASKYY